MHPVAFSAPGTPLPAAEPANLRGFFGVICFLAAVLLLFPERTNETGFRVGVPTRR